MAGMIDKLLGSNETLVYRTRVDRRLIAKWLAGFFGAAAMFAAAAWFLFGADMLHIALLLYAVVAPVILMTVLPDKDRGTSKAFVTDQRVLYWRDVAGIDLQEIPLGRIERIEAVGRRRVTLRTRGGETRPLHAVFEPDKLAAAIAAQAGLPPPQAGATKDGTDTEGHGANGN